MKNQRNRAPLPATYFGPRPGDFALGSLESRAAARALVSHQTTEQLESEEIELANLTPFELAVTDGYTGLLKVWMYNLALLAEEKAEIYGFSLPTPAEARHSLAVARLADELSGGRLLELLSSDPDKAAEWRNMAEEKLRKSAPKSRDS